ncbi:MAG TPA: hypothetical protein PK400_01770 [Phycisphaerales bacterium]|nr:hypothetical protein [Phycisphaerales bacterium]HRQ76490.1 hypothetical protein [Phycisphaerales bacterium]
MIDQTIVLKIGVALALGLAGCVLVCWRRLFELEARQFSTVIWTLMLASRLGGFITLFVILGLEPRSDVQTYFFWSHLILDGHIPTHHADLPLHYGPAFLYITTGALMLWDSAKCLVLVAILFDLATFPLWLATARRAFDETIVRRAAILYIFAPVPFGSIVISGQNHIWVGFLIALCFYLMGKNRVGAAAFAMGLSVVAVKFLNLLYMPIMAAQSRRWVTMGVGFLLPVVIAYGVAWYYNINPIDGILFHAEHFSSGTVPFLLTAFGWPMDGVIFSRTMKIISLLALASIFLPAWITGSLRREDAVILMLSAITYTFLLVSTKGFAGYATMVFFPVCILFALVRVRLFALGVFVCYGVLASIASSLWYRVITARDMSFIVLDKSHGVPTMHLVVFMAVEVALVACHAVLLWWSLRMLYGRQPTTSAEIPRSS